MCWWGESSAVESLEEFVITAKSEAPWAAEGVRAERVRIVETKKTDNEHLNNPANKASHLS